VDLEQIERLLVEDKGRQLEVAAETMADQGVPIATRVLLGDPVVDVIRAVVHEGFDFLVKSPAPLQGVRDRLFGSIDRRLMRACPCPVAIARARTGPGSGCAIAAVDYDEDDPVKARLNRTILDAAAFLLTGDYYKDLHVVHAWSFYGESLLSQGRTRIPKARLEALIDEERTHRRRWLQGLVDDYRQTLAGTEAAAFEPKLELLRGEPAAVIPKRAKELNAELIGLGTVARTGVSGLLMGNTAEALLDRVDCTVVALKPEGFVSPISQA
jgi:nucleotide-binding universal stress UspA family protein